MKGDDRVEELANRQLDGTGGEMIDGMVWILERRFYRKRGG
jgi:hypothetical protein